MVLETTPKEYATLQQFELLKKKKRLGQLPTTQLTTPLWLNNRQARELGYDVPEGEGFLIEPSAPEVRAISGRIPQPTITEIPITSTIPTALTPTLTQTSGRELQILTDVYPKYPGYKVDEVNQAVESLRQELAADPQRFLEDLTLRATLPEGEGVLRMLAIPEEVIDEIVGVEVREQELKDLISRTFPELDGQDFAEFIETDFDTFIDRMRTGGRTKEKQDLLQAMGYSWEDIGQILAIQKVVVPIDGIRKQVTATEDGRVFDEKGKQVGTYNPVTAEFTKLPVESV